VFWLGVAMSCVNIPTQTVMQERSPEESRARVLSFQFMLYNAGTIPVLLFAGIIAQYVGFVQLVVLISTGLLLFALWGCWYAYHHQNPSSKENP
ncbi:MAG: MFS transporter, partial [Ktedonobacteraceae bacterium]|nr:MFS transporter [Ktedonobacteraceae bacterium]